MARLLDPSVFGLMAMCVVALRFFAYFSQLGLGAALVQREHLCDEDIRCALGITWIVCILAAMAVVATAPIAGWFFDNVDVVLLIRILSINLLILGFNSVSTAILRRSLRFKELAAVETVSYVLGYGIVGTLLAWQGAGIWSLVVATVSQNFLGFVGAYFLTRHPIRPSLKGNISALFKYGTQYSIIGFIEFLSANLDSAIIGRFLGSTSLGLYNRALLLTNQPVEKAAGVLARVLFPVLSKVQQDRLKIGNVFLLGVSVIGLFGGAVSLGISAAASDLVLVVLGGKWMDTIPVVEILSLSVPFMFMSNVAGVVCDSLAMLNFKLFVQSAGLTLIATLMLILYPGGVTQIAWAIVCGEAFRFLVYFLFLAQKLQLKKPNVLRILSSVFIVSSLSYMLISVVSETGSRLGINAHFALLIECLVGVVVLGMGLMLWIWLMQGTDPEAMARDQIPGWNKFRTFIFAQNR